ncbi:MAG TPA: NAD(P)H-quinone oxidoreductase [Gemmatimonadota bacterium]|nr:NAD(P)H-quinone oxidoreductase [Gemmatimonadota bacterium]
MRAVEIARPGGPEVLVPASRPTPVPGPGEILIAVHAAGVNRPDVVQREGRYPPPPGASDLPGLEVAGTVASRGEGARRFEVGAEVCALAAGGGYAEYCAVPEVQALPVPRGLTLVDAAAVPETFFTVWTNVFERGGLVAGESILVQGGSGGIGTAAIQLASARGARVFTTAGGAEKCRICQVLGAERAIDHETEAYDEVVREATGGRGVDVVLDMLGGPHIARHLAILAPEGRLVLIAFLEGREATLDLWPVMGKRLTVTGSTLRPRSPAEKGAIARALEAEVWPLIESGRVRPRIDATFPLEEAAEAHRRLESRLHVGKIVLVVRKS